MVHLALNSFKRIGCFGKIFGQHRHPMDDVTSLDQIGNEKEELKLKLLANLENKLRNRDYLLNQLQKRHSSSEMPIRRALSLEHKLDEVALDKVRRRSRQVDSPISRPSANHCSRRQKINHSYLGNNPVQPIGSRTATPGTKRPISVIFLTPEKEGRRGSLANLKALSAAERTKIEASLQNIKWARSQKQPDSKDDILCKKIDKVAEHLNRQKPVLITSKGGPISSLNSEKSEKTTSRMRNRTVSK